MDLLKPMKTDITKTVFQKAENFVLKIPEGKSYKSVASTLKGLGMATTAHLFLNRLHGDWSTKSS